MGQPAEMVHVFTDRAIESDREFGSHRPLSARRALAVWIALSALGWGAIATIVTMTFF